MSTTNQGRFEFRADNDSLVEQIINDPHYRIFPDGTIFTLITRTGQVSVRNAWRLAGSITKEGYRRLRYGGKTIFAHRVIYRAFKGKIDSSLTINHINGIKSDNRIENLELATQSEQNFHRFQVLKHRPVIGHKKISKEIADEMRKDSRNGLNYRELMAKYNVSKTTVSYVIRNFIWN